MRYQRTFSLNTQEVEKKEASPRIYAKTMNDPSYFFILLSYVYQYIFSNILLFDCGFEMQIFKKSYILFLMIFMIFNAAVSCRITKYITPRVLQQIFKDACMRPLSLHVQVSHVISWWHPGMKRKLSVYTSSQDSTTLPFLLHCSLSYSAL